MVQAIALILAMQLLGEGAARLTGLGVPGPVIGLLLLALIVTLSRQVRDTVRPLATNLLAHLSLLFVPAAVGVIQHLGVFSQHIWPLVLALTVSTVLTLAVTALTFVAVARLTAAEPQTTGKGD